MAVAMAGTCSRCGTAAEVVVEPRQARLNKWREGIPCATCSQPVRLEVRPTERQPGHRRPPADLAVD